MKRLLAASVAVFFIVAGTAEAAPRHNHKAHHRHFVPDANGNGATIIGGRPAGCPHAFCGCEASLFLFGTIKPKLNLAWNWARLFPRTEPAPRMAAVRPGHVMVLLRQISGKIWWVHDGNSGHHLTREHARSIAGYTIVDPNSHRYASAQ